MPDCPPGGAELGETCPVIAPRRRLLLIPAVALVLLGTPALALEQPSMPAPETSSVALETPAGEVQPGWRASTGADANLVGVKWQGDPGAAFQIEVRAEGQSGWEPAGTLGGDDTGADDGTRDAAAARVDREGAHVTEPVWVGDASDVRVTLVSGSASAVSVETVVADSPRAPGGSAGAIGMPFVSGPDRFGFAIALVLTGLVLGAIALGWAPWRSRRHGAFALLLAAVTLTGCLPASPNPVSSTSQPPMTMRSQWGPDLGWNPDPACNGGPEYTMDMNFVVIHHTVNSNAYGPNDSVAMVRAIWSYHVRTLGYCDIAYNFIVDKYGQIFEGRLGGTWRFVIGAHTGGFNRESSGMAFLGNHTSEQPTTAAWNAMVDLVTWKLSLHHLDPASGFSAVSNGFGARWPAGTKVSFPNRIVGHRDLWPTACPGDAFYPRLPELRAAVQPRVGWQDGAPPPPPLGPPTSTTTTLAPPTTTTT